MIQNIKGMPDLLPAETSRWQFVEKKLRMILDAYAYQEIRTPILEETALFVRSVGEHTDIVGKEMFTFTDQGEVQMTLRPEGTASVMRAYLQHHIEKQTAFSKFYYMGPMFRRERPQKGRLRQFHQLGAEAIGKRDPWVDIEIIALLMHICESFELPDIRLEINSLGDSETRKTYRDVLQNYFHKHASVLSEGEKARLEKNPLRLLDSKNPDLAKIIAEAPSILEHLTDESKKYFDQVQQGLRDSKIPFHINPRIVRGLDYYSHTAFEVMISGLGSQNTVGAGGRYDKLSTELGEKEIPAIGFAMGIDRLILCIEEKLKLQNQKRIEVISLDEKTRATAFSIAQNLRKSFNDHIIDMQFDVKSLKAALRLADKNNAAHAIIVGENEWKEKKATIKNLSSSEQANVAFDDVVKYLKEKS